MALIIRKRISASIILFMFTTAIMLGLTTYMLYLPFLETSVDFRITTIIYVLSAMGIAWHSCLDYIIHNLFSKQLIIVETIKLNKFHIKNAISICTWALSLMWATSIFVIATLPQQEYVEYYPNYILVFSMFYIMMSGIRTLWNSNKKWWVFDLMLAVAVKFVINIITAALFVITIKLF